MKRAISTAFDAPGTFAAETLIDIVQRAVACLQDAGAERVAGVSLSLTVVDRHGAPCPLCLDGETLDQLTLDVADLALDVPAAKLTVGQPSARTASHPAAHPGRRYTNRRRRA